MVYPDSCKISRVQQYSGILIMRLYFFVYGAITLYSIAFQQILLKYSFVTHLGRYSCLTKYPTTP